MLKILKNNALPIAMIVGALGYKLFTHLAFLTPYLIIAMLFVTFCRISPRNLKIEKWHIWILLLQILGSIGVFFILRPINIILAQGVMICILAPTATAAPVITGKLGGSIESLTTYTLLSNFAVAIFAPAAFPLIEMGAHLNFWDGFITIIQKVFPLLIGPFVAAWICQKFAPALQAKITSIPSLAFYLWVVSLTIVTARTVRSIIEEPQDGHIVGFIALGALVVCIIQFALGKAIGGAYNNRIAGGQAFGQKNTILAIWMAHTYLNPISAIGPGTYVLWQNVVNSWQLWRKRNGKKVI